MATGFIYIVDTLTKDYVQKDFCSVPTAYGNRIYFGPCKKWMRPKMTPGDYIFGVSPKKVGPRRIVFVCVIEERTTFKEAYHRFPQLRGPSGPIHVRPIKGRGSFPRCSYEHIPGSKHAGKKWESDLASPDLDAFFVCSPRNGSLGPWLGKYGPEVDPEILDFFKTCSVHSSGLLSVRNVDATLRNPIAYRKPGRYGKLHAYLYLETDEPEVLVSLCERRMKGMVRHLDRVPIPDRQTKAIGGCRRGQSSRECR